MAQRTAALMAVLLVAASLLSAAEAGVADRSFGWISAGSRCRGTIGDCLGGGGDEEELMMGSEASRRILATSSHISYRALKRGSTPCSVKGASYYNCRPGGQANPYRRSCSRIARCRS